MLFILIMCGMGVFAQQVVVSHDGATIRTTPDRNSTTNICATVKGGTILSSTGFDNLDMYGVYYQGKKCYVESERIILPDLPPDENPRMITIDKGRTNVRVRAGASTKSKVLGYVNSNDFFPYLGETKEWYKISYYNKTGWVSKRYSR